MTNNPKVIRLNYNSLLRIVLLLPIFWFSFNTIGTASLVLDAFILVTVFVPSKEVLLPLLLILVVNIGLYFNYFVEDLTLSSWVIIEHIFPTKFLSIDISYLIVLIIICLLFKHKTISYNHDSI